jgi:IS605 OrfB family transposase
LIRTFETRLDFRDKDDLAPVLDAYADLMNRVQRTLYAKLRAGRVWTGDLHKTLYREFNITSTHLLHAYRALQGQLSSISELAKQRKKTLDMKIKSKIGVIASKRKTVETEREKQKVLARQIDKFSKAVSKLKVKLDSAKPSQHEKVLARLKKALTKYHLAEAKLGGSMTLVRRSKRDIHQHMRKLDILRHKLCVTELQIENPSICFGSKKRFQKQYHLDENDIPSHFAWLEEWQRSRSNTFMFEGDMSVESGNPFARLKLRKDGLFDMELRLPEALKHLATKTFISGGSEVRSVVIKGLHFLHGAETIAEALNDKNPISIRFHRDETSWKAMVTVNQATPKAVRDYRSGAVGVDVNVGFLSVSRIDGHGNVVETFDIPCVTYGKSEDQSRDALRKAAAQIAAYAQQHDLPVVSERLDFSSKKDRLSTADGPRYARMLSSFTYSAFDAALASACARSGIYHARVNPAYTSIIGRTKFAARYGLTVHAAAAVSIARRAMGLSERLPRSVEQERKVTLPLNNAHHVTLDLPVRKEKSEQAPKSRHVWSVWNEVNRAFKGAHAAHRPSKRKRNRPKLVANGVGGRNDLRSTVYRHRKDVPGGVAQSSDQWLDPGAERDHIPFEVDVGSTAYVH